MRMGAYLYDGALKQVLYTASHSHQECQDCQSDSIFLSEVASGKSIKVSD